MKDISQLFVNLGKGVKYIFVDAPKKLFKIKDKKEEIKPNENSDTQEETVENPNEAVVYKKKKSIGDSINDWYNNIPSVKKKREAYEASLVPFQLDPNGSDGVKSTEKKLYRYLARNEEGKLVTDYFAAFSKLDVYSYLTDNKFTVYKIETNKSIEFLHGQSFGGMSKMATKDLVFWLTQLATYIKAGIPLTDAVKVLAQQDKRKKYAMLYEAIIYELTMGQTFSEALNKQGHAFPGLLVNMIKSSEMTGSIEETLEEMADYYQEIEDTKRAIKSALAYPCIVLLFAGGIVIFMLTYIIPKFVNVYESMDAEIPKITQITLDISAFLQNQYMTLILIIAGIIFAFIFSYKKIKAFRMFIQSLLMKMPVVGPLMISKEMTMFSRTFASLQKNNVLLTDSIDILAKITSNEIYKELELRTIQNLIKGNKMSETFKNHWAIPDVAYFMIVTGESTGELAEMLDKVADFYNKQEKNSVATIKTFIEPVMILLLAVVVGFLLIAILIPMFGIYSTVA